MVIKSIQLKKESKRAFRVGKKAVEIAIERGRKRWEWHYIEAKGRNYYWEESRKYFYLLPDGRTQNFQGSGLLLG